MHDLPTDWSALCAVIFLLGMRHGFDADHLASIDGLTRLSARRQQWFSRYCGTLFSLGHGAVVLAIATSVGLLSQRWTPPGWLSAFGAWTSILLLLALGIANWYAMLTTTPDNQVSLVGFKSRFLGRILQVNSVWGIGGVGALFALSFDTVSQAALFAITATQYGGVWHSIMLGLLFVLGMLVTDGLNGWWISRLIARADQIALLASRIMSAADATISLLIAALGIGKLTAPWIQQWSEGKDMAFGAIVVAVMLASYLLARALARISTRTALTAQPPRD